MNRSLRYLSEIILFLGLIAIGIWLIMPALEQAFLANPIVNGSILTVLLIGIMLVFKALYDLMAAQRWSAAFRDAEDIHSQKTDDINSQSSPKLIRPTANLLRQRANEMGYLQLNSMGMRAILEGLSVRLDEARETLRYVVGLLVFLGLLGTFWGLMQTIQAVSGVIDGLNSQGGDVTGGFQSLKEGLKTPLSGMGTAFSSSLFGLAGSLILGFCALRVSHAQNHFYQDYEEWLSSLTRLSGTNVGDGEGSGMGLAISLLEQTADSIDRLQQIIGRSESHQKELYAHMGDLNQRLSTLIESQKIEHDLMRKLAEGQLSTRQLLERMNEQDSGASGKTGISSASLKPIESLITQLVRELHEGREETVKSVRNEFRILARTISYDLNSTMAKRNRGDHKQAQQQVEHQNLDEGLETSTPNLKANAPPKAPETPDSKLPHLPRLRPVPRNPSSNDNQ